MKTIKRIKLALSVGGRFNPIAAIYWNIKGGYWLGRLTNKGGDS